MAREGGHEWYPSIDVAGVIFFAYIIFIFKVHGPLNFKKRFRAPQELFMKRDWDVCCKKKT
jgi:hypothetical protein